MQVYICEYVQVWINEWVCHYMQVKKEKIIFAKNLPSPLYSEWTLSSMLEECKEWDNLAICA